MGFLNALIGWLKQLVKNFVASLKVPSSNLVTPDYDFGRDIGQKGLYVIMMLGAFWLPRMYSAAWFLMSSIFGFIIIAIIIMPMLKRKSKELLKKEKAKRFLHMSPRIWNCIVMISLVPFFIADLLIDFYISDLVMFPICLIISYGLLTKNATLISTESDETRRWREENGVERVYGIKHNGKAVWRDKNGNYYSKAGREYISIPTQVEFTDKKR